eukprot:5448540-Lingulodinium_polyedra.AAC.1
MDGVALAWGGGVRQQSVAPPSAGAPCGSTCLSRRRPGYSETSGLTRATPPSVSGPQTRTIGNTSWAICC